MIERLKHILRARSESEVQTLARETDQWLKDDTLNLGLAALRQALIERWLRSETMEERERCWFEIHRINAFVKQLRVIVDGDKKRQVEKEKLERAQSAGPRVG